MENKNVNHWELTDELRDKFKPIIENLIHELELVDIEKTPFEKYPKLDLTSKGINPYQLTILLSELGYEEGEYDSNGWQHDFWQEMTNNEKSGLAKELIVQGCGAIFTLEVVAKDE